MKHVLDIIKALAIALGIMLMLRTWLWIETKPLRDAKADHAMWRRVERLAGR